MRSRYLEEKNGVRNLGCALWEMCGLIYSGGRWNWSWRAMLWTQVGIGSECSFGDNRPVPFLKKRPGKKSVGVLC